MSRALSRRLARVSHVGEYRSIHRYACHLATTLNVDVGDLLAEATVLAARFADLNAHSLEQKIAVVANDWEREPQDVHDELTDLLESLA